MSSNLHCRTASFKLVQFQGVMATLLCVCFLAVRSSRSPDNESLLTNFEDGGGMRGIASLLFLEAVMDKAAPDKEPWQVFDIIGGTSTGG